jgi:hypothetical protein
MGLLVRMLEKQKWEKINLVEAGLDRTPADTITSELRTRANSLSLWLINNIDELLNVVLALAVGRNQITRLDVMILDEQDFEQSGLSVNHTPENGLSPIHDINEFHYDLVNMDYEKLGHLSQLILENINDQNKCRRFDKSSIKKILYEGYTTQRFEIEELDEKLQEELIKVIKREKEKNE